MLPVGQLDSHRFNVQYGSGTALLTELIALQVDGFVTLGSDNEALSVDGHPFARSTTEKISGKY